MSQAIERSTPIPSRRAVLAGLAAAPALAAPAFALGGPDPIFAAIERHKALYAAFCRALTGMGECEKRSGFADSPELDEWHRRESEACDAEMAAHDEMLATVPTTLAGLLALLRYVEQESGFGFGRGFKETISATVTALEQIGAVS
jgi:hypothetical protein